MKDILRTYIHGLETPALDTGVEVSQCKEAFVKLDFASFGGCAPRRNSFPKACRSSNYGPCSPLQASGRGRLEWNTVFCNVANAGRIRPLILAVLIHEVVQGLWQPVCSL